MKSLIIHLILCSLGLSCTLNSLAIAGTESPSTIPSRLVGSTGTYKAKRSEPLRLVAGKLGVIPADLARANGLKTNSMLKAGQSVSYNNLRIVPLSAGKQIRVNIADKTIYLYDRSGKFSYYSPVAVGNPATPTPTGSFEVIGKATNPNWHVPLSVQEEMRKKGKPVFKVVRPGPNNPLGRFAVRTSIPALLIHSTDKPASIYGFNSHGCIRVDPERIEEVYRRSATGMKGDIVYQPVKLAAKNDGRIFVEVHKNVYGKKINLEAAVREEFRRHGLSDKVDWTRVNKTVADKSGFAVEVSKQHSALATT